jgi:hypothetical protein
VIKNKTTFFIDVDFMPKLKLLKQEFNKNVDIFLKVLMKLLLFFPKID